MTSSPSSFAYPVLFRERPYVYVISNEAAADYCHYCMKGSSAKVLSRCSACRFAHYCDRQCQRAAFTDHKHECRCLQKMGAGRVPSAHVRLIARLFFKRQQPYVPDERLPEQLKQRQLDNLMNHMDNYRKDSALMAAFKNIFSELRVYMGDAIDESTALDLHGKLNTNAAALNSGLNPECGRALYLGFSALDHSCDPDTFAFPDGVDLVVRARKPGVEAKDPRQLTISYLPGVGLRTTSDRRRQLAKGYFFHCLCPVCLDQKRDAEMRSMRCQFCSAAVPIADEEPQKKLATCLCGRQNDVVEAVDVMKTIETVLRVLEAGGIEKMKAKMGEARFETLKNDTLEVEKDLARTLLSSINVYAARLSQAVMQFGVSSKEEAINLYQLSWPAYQRFTSPELPERLVLTMNMGFVYINSDDPSKKEEGIQLLNLAAPIFEMYNEGQRANECRMAVAKTGH